MVGPGSHRRSILLGIGLCFVLVMFLAFGFGYYAVTPKDRTGQPRIFLVRNGASLKEVAAELQDKGLISNKYLFILWGRILGYSKQIKAGEYQISASMTPVRILATFAKGTILTHMVTVPEGYTMAQKGIVQEKDFLRVCRDPKIISKYGIEGATLEGYLYPDSYQFSRGLSPEKVVDVMVHRFWQMVTPYIDRAKEQGLSVKQMVTLASIVEKETGLAKERPLIASVFLNRLKRKMKLESDPTVIYGLPDFNGNLTRKDLAKKTPSWAHSKPRDRFHKGSTLSGQHNLPLFCLQKRWKPLFFQHLKRA